MATRKRFYVIDDDKKELAILVSYLEEAGHDVRSSDSSVQAVREIQNDRPDCVISDLMMPELDGLEVLVKLREQRSFDDVKIIIVSGKSYEFDEIRAKELGADGYVKKPIDREKFMNKVVEVMEDKIELRYWGVRGTLPVAGEQMRKYGGNTSCISMQFPNDRLFIFDAGSGIRKLGQHLLMTKKSRISAKLFISHPHWDHINALPFFVPLYIQGNEFEICGPAQANLGMRDLVSAQMEGVYFPITMREFGSNVFFRNLREETLDIDGITVHTRLLSHPGYCLGYRVDYHGRSICYVTDNELFLPGTPEYNEYYVEQLTEFIKGSDILITDTTYTDEAYKSKVGWGHSCIGQVVDLAHKAQVKELNLFHHDPDEDDDAIDRKLDMATKLLEERKSDTIVTAPKEAELRLL